MSARTDGGNSSVPPSAPSTAAGNVSPRTKRTEQRKSGFLKPLFINLAVLLVATGIVFRIFVGYAMKECIETRNSLPNQTGKTFVITGGNQGLGYATTEILAQLNARVVIGCRNVTSGEQAKQKILTGNSKADIQVLELDLASLASVRNFANKVKKQHPKGIDALVNNAGIMAIPTRQETIDGFESQIGVNHFGHFLLSALLFSSLKAQGRIVNHSSSAAMFAAANFTFNDLDSSKSYSPWVAYGNSKAANLLFTYELNKRLRGSKKNKNNITAVAVHPGYTATNLQKDKFPLWEMAGKLVAMEPKDGALSQVVAIVDPTIGPSVGTYIGPKFLSFGAPVVAVTPAGSSDPQQAAKLWQESVRLTKYDFDL
jgi:NAD(P)-dependent dehydrogenase (short-subunit alcohol dehydrogenase family)